MKTGKRPVGVWLVFILTLFSVLLVGAATVMILSGAVPLIGSQKAYFEKVGFFGLTASLVIGTLNIAGAISLFRLHKLAVLLFGSALALNMAESVREAMIANWLEVVRGGVMGAMSELLFALVILLYAMRLLRKGVLT